MHVSSGFRFPDSSESTWKVARPHQHEPLARSVDIVVFCVSSDIAAFREFDIGVGSGRIAVVVRLNNRSLKFLRFKSKTFR